MPDLYTQLAELEMSLATAISQGYIDLINDLEANIAAVKVQLAELNALAGE